MLSSPNIERLDHRFLALTRLAQRLLTLQPGHSLISPKLTLSVGSSISITLHAATQARRSLALSAVGLPSPVRESHPMDHDSNSSGHAKNKDLPPSFDRCIDDTERAVVPTVATALHALYPKPESRTDQRGNFRTPGEFRPWCS